MCTKFASAHRGNKHTIRNFEKKLHCVTSRYELRYIKQIPCIHACDPFYSAIWKTVRFVNWEFVGPKTFVREIFHLLDIAGTMYYLVIYMQSNKIPKVIFN